ncbi:MAG TPA: calcium-binding protein [Tepidisphaeraceae bacterium]|nr:calcium-binding protein [Tepidisphaeraceae bacterium]
MIQRDYRSGLSIEWLESRRLLSLTPVEPEVTVPVGAARYQFDMAVAGDGSFIVVSDPAQDHFQPDSPEVIAVRYDAGGRQVGAPITLDDDGFNVRVSMDAEGEAVVAYQQDADGVYVVRISKAGVVSAPQLVGTAPVGVSIGDVAVSMDDGGGFFVIWMQLHENQRPVEQIRAFDAAGRPRGPQFNLRGGTATNPHRNLDIAAHRDGSGAVVTYVEANESTDSSYFERVSTSSVLGPRSLELDVGDVAPQAATYRDGSFVVGALFGSRSSPHDGRARRFDANGAAVGDEIVIGESLPVTQFNVRNIRALSIDALPDGGLLAGYVHEQDGLATTYAERFSASGVSVGGPVGLGVGPAKGHRIGAGLDGTAVIAYLQMSANESTPGGFLPGEVHFRRLSFSFTRLVGAELYVNGTAGNDHIIVERVRERVFVNINGVVDGYDASRVQLLSINGFGGDDDIDNNTALPSTIHGGDGHDTIWGGTGDDRIHGFGGGDVLRGGDGSDALFGGTGGDWLHGGNGNDYLAGEAGEDALYGASGADLLRGQHGSDALYGEAGNDTLHGDAGGDYLEGGAGHDALISGGEADALFGLAGVDRLFSAGDGFRDTVRGGLGSDTAQVDQEDDVLAVETT